MISTRAFITAVVVLLTMAWLVQRVSSSETVDKATLSSWTDIQAINTCLVEGAELLEQRYADYHAVLAPSKDVWPTWRGFVGFGMGSDDILRTQAPCKPWFHSDDPDLNTQAKNYVKAYDRLRPDALAIERWLGDRSNELPSPNSTDSNKPSTWACKTYVPKRYRCARPWSNRNCMFASNSWRPSKHAWAVTSIGRPCAS